MNPYRPCYFELVKHKNRIEEKIANGNVALLEAFVDQLLCKAPYHYYRGTAKSMARSIASWNKAFQVQDAGAKLKFKNKSSEYVFDYLSKNGITKGNFHIVFNGRQHIDRRLAINTTTQESAIEVADRLVRLGDKLSSYVKKITIQLTSSFQSQMPHSKVEILYASDKISERAPYSDKHGRELIRLIKQVSSASNSFDPFYCRSTGLEGCAFGEEPRVAGRTFSGLRTSIMVRIFLNQGFPKNADQFEELVSSEFILNKINPEIPYLNKSV